MAVKTIEVSVTRHILRIGSAAYPLANIARVQSRKLVNRRWPPVRACIVAVLVWLVLGIAATVAIRYAYNHDAGFADSGQEQHYLNIAVLVPVASVAVSLLRLVYQLARSWRSYYALVIETAGSASAALVNPDRGVITDLVAKITRAIDDPANPVNHFTIPVSNVTNNNYGHQNAQFGAGSSMSGV